MSRSHRPRFIPYCDRVTPGWRGRLSRLLATLSVAVLAWSPAVWAEDSFPATNPVRSTEAGKVAGLDGDVLTFKGIPYAAPPVGALRWRPPQQPQQWKGVRQAAQFGADCFGDARLRQGSLAPNMSEDCLYLNVWAPRDGGARTHPVMVWVYGGSFTGGTSALSMYDGAALAQKGVVVVTFNYRTNIFGFFAHPALSLESQQGVSGNYGLLDILAALRWVKGNIGAFGGDPRQVTVFGESAGASALGLLLTSPQSQGLFQRAILESPGLTRPLATLSESSALGLKLGDLANLRSMDAAALMSLAQSGLPAVRSLEKPRPIGPIIDGWLLPRSDRDAIDSGRFLHVPLLIGSNADEGRLFTRAIPVATRADYQQYLEAQFGAGAATMARCYPAKSDQDVPQAVSRLFGGEEFIRGIDAFSVAWAARKVPVWRYRFDGPGDPGIPPPTHAGELPFVFLRGGATPADRSLSERMATAWTTFAKSGDPNGAGLPNWPVYNPGGSLMVFGPTIGPEPARPLRRTADCSGEPRSGTADAKG